MPSDVESPICATDVQEVRSGPFCSAADSGAGLFFPAGAALAWLTELVAPASAPVAAPSAAALEVAGTATSPARPVHATRTTPAPPATAASPEGPRLGNF